MDFSNIEINSVVPLSKRFREKLELVNYFRITYLNHYGTNQNNLYIQGKGLLFCGQVNILPV